MQELGPFTCTLSILMLSAVASVGLADEVYTGIKHEPLSAALGVQIKEHHIGELEFLWPNALGIRHLTLNVFPTEEAAREWFRLWFRRVSVGPSRPPDGQAIGDEFLWWRGMVDSDTVTGIQVRRRNVCFLFAGGSVGGLQVNEAVQIARQIDALIRDDRAIAPLGTFDPPPEIVDAGLPATLPVRPTERRLLNQQPVPFGEPARAIVRINPQFRGLGPPEGLRLHVDIEGFGSNQVGPDGRSRDLVDVPDGSGRVSNLREKSAEHDGRFLLELRRLPSQPTTRKVRVTAANADNVIVTREFEVELVPAR